MVLCREVPLSKGKARGCEVKQQQGIAPNRTATIRKGEAMQRNTEPFTAKAKQGIATQRRGAVVQRGAKAKQGIATQRQGVVVQRPAKAKHRKVEQRKGMAMLRPAVQRQSGARLGHATAKQSVAKRCGGAERLNGRPWRLIIHQPKQGNAIIYDQAKPKKKQMERKA